MKCDNWRWFRIAIYVYGSIEFVCIGSLYAIEIEIKRQTSNLYVPFLRFQSISIEIKLFLR